MPYRDYLRAGNEEGSAGSTPDAGSGGDTEAGGSGDTLAGKPYLYNESFGVDEMNAKLNNDYLSGPIMEMNYTWIVDKRAQFQENGAGENDNVLDPVKVEEEQNEAVNPEEVSQVKQLPKSLQDYSGFHDLTSTIISGTNAVKEKVNKALTVPNIDVLNQKMLASAAKNNLNVGAVNTALAITKSALCGDDNALVFDLTSMINALDYDYDFLRSFNICGRSKFRNPIDTLLKGFDNLKHQSRMITGLAKRLFNNTQKAVKKFVNTVNLPTSIEACLTSKSILQNTSDLGPGIPIGKINKFLNSIAPAICSNDTAGIVADERVVQKAAVTPFIRGLTTYDKKSMYAYYSAILLKSGIDKSILLEILSECFDIMKNKYTTNILELMAFTKIIMAKKKDGSVPVSINAINKDMHKYADSETLVLDNILEANKSGKLVSPAEITNIRGEYVEDIYASCNVKAVQILNNFADDLSGSKNPVKTFNTTMQLLTIVDPTFNANIHADVISKCHQLGALAERSFFSSSNKVLPSNLITEDDGRKFLEIEEEELSLMDNVGILHYVAHNVTKDCIDIKES